MRWMPAAILGGALVLGAAMLAEGLRSAADTGGKHLERASLHLSGSLERASDRLSRALVTAAHEVTITHVIRPPPNGPPSWWPF